MSWNEQPYAPHLLFAKEYLEQFQVDLRIADSPFTDFTGDDIQFFQRYFPNENLISYFQNVYARMEQHKIYHIKDDFLRTYLTFLLPGDNIESMAVIGPYLLSRPTMDELHTFASTMKLPPSAFADFASYYDGLTLLSDDAIIYATVNTLASRLWPEGTKISFVDSYEAFSVSGATPHLREQLNEPQEPMFRIRMLETRYKLEQEFLAAVSRGQVHQAELLHNRFISAQRAEDRSPNPLRNSQNYMIILNTLLRKAAEQGFVHPLHIDKLSSQFAQKIEALDASSSIPLFSRDMVRKYCILVKNYSMVRYSGHIRDAITLITADVSAELNLNKIATALNVNPSYLSALFKKEVGVTLTEYVTTKRMDHAIFLLNTTSLPISTIALYCGIPDVQYFSKLFKKRIGKSPSAYKKLITGQ